MICCWTSDHFAKFFFRHDIHISRLLVNHWKTYFFENKQPQYINKSRCLVRLVALSSALQHESQRRLASWATMPPLRYVEENSCRSAKDLPYVLCKGFTILSHTSVNQSIDQNKPGGVYVSPPRIPKYDLINRVRKTQSFYTWHCLSIIHFLRDARRSHIMDQQGGRNFPFGGVYTYVLLYS